MTKRFELSSPYSKFNWNTKEDHAGNPCAKGEPSTIPYPRYRLKYGVFSAYTTVNTRSKGFILNYRQWDQWSILWIAASLLLKRKVHLRKALPKALALSFYYHGCEIHRKQQVKSNCSQQHFCKQWAPSLKGRKFNSNRTAGCTQWGWGRAPGLFLETPSSKLSGTIRCHQMQWLQQQEGSHLSPTGHCAALSGCQYLRNVLPITLVLKT